MVPWFLELTGRFRLAPLLHPLQRILRGIDVYRSADSIYYPLSILHNSFNPGTCGLNRFLPVSIIIYLSNISSNTIRWPCRSPIAAHGDSNAIQPKQCTHILPQHIDHLHPDYRNQQIWITQYHKAVGSFCDGEAPRAAIVDSIKAFSLNNEIEDGDIAGQGSSADTTKDWEVGRSRKIEQLIPYDHFSPLEDGNPRHGISTVHWRFYFRNLQSRRMII